MPAVGGGCVVSAGKEWSISIWGSDGLSLPNLENCTFSLVLSMSSIPVVEVSILVSVSDSLSSEDSLNDAESSKMALKMSMEGLAAGSTGGAVGCEKIKQKLIKLTTYRLRYNT